MLINNKTSKKIILIIIITIILSAFKVLYNNSKYGFNKINQVIYFQSSLPQYVILKLESVISDFYSNEFQNNLFIFHKPSFKILFDINYSEKIIVEYDFPKSSEYEKIINEIFQVAKLDLTERALVTSDFTLNKLEIISINIINKSLPFYRIFLLIFIILIILFTTYESFKNQKH